MNYPKATWDRQANAASIEFKDVGVGEAETQMPVEDANGEIAAVLDFSSAGELLGIELLDAETQLPRIFRDS